MRTSRVRLADALLVFLLVLLPMMLVLIVVPLPGVMRRLMLDCPYM